MNITLFTLVLYLCLSCPGFRARALNLVDVW